MNFAFTEKNNSGKTSKKCVFNVNFIISNPINSTVLHRLKKVKVIQSGMSQKTPFPDRISSISQPHKFSSVYTPMVIGKGGVEGK